MRERLSYYRSEEINAEMTLMVFGFATHPSMLAAGNRVVDNDFNTLSKKA